MANKKISELAAAGAITGAEQVPVVQGGVTKRTTVADLPLGSGTYVAYAAAPTGVGATDTATIADALAALPAAGGQVILQQGTYVITTGLVVPANCQLRGQGPGTILSGTGIVIVTLRSEASLCDLQVLDPTGNASTVGVKAFTTATFTWKWALHRVFIRGNTALGDPNYLGTGLLCDFGLEATVEDCTIEFWDVGVSLINDANAVAMVGCKVRQNITGVSTAADTAMTNCVIEGNRTGIAASAGRLALSLCHLENVIGATGYTNISISGTATYRGVGNGFYGAVTDITITAGALTHSSFGDLFNGNLAHAGTGIFGIYEAQHDSYTKSGAGKFLECRSGSVTGTNMTGTDIVYDGFNQVVFGSDLSAKVGRLLRIFASSGQRVTLTDESANEKVTVSSAGVGFYGTTPVARPDAVTAKAALEALGLATSVTKDYVDLTTGQTVAGAKTFTGMVTVPADGWGLSSGGIDRFYFGTAGVMLLKSNNYVFRDDGDVARVTIAANGEIEVPTVGAGVILKSPDGTRYRIVVANGGALSTVAV